MSDRPLTAEDMAGWRYTCVTHQWMSNRVPCPDGDGTDSGPQGPSAEEPQL